jgi:glutamate:GABA antiporter
MGNGQGTNRVNEQFTPTVLQSAMGEPLRSEQRTGELLPRILSRIDLFIIFIAIVLFIPNASVVQATQGAGAATYLYWILGAITFLLPGAIVCGQLNRFMPVDGGIYVWSHRALGPLWGFFAGFCAWFPGVLVPLSAGASVLWLIQGISVTLSGNSLGWLAAPWQQGLLVIASLLLMGWISTWSLSLIMKIGKVIICLYLVSIFAVGLAGGVWLVSGHPPQPTLVNHSAWGLSGHNIVLYGVIVLALLGVEVPLNMGAEIKKPKAASLFLRWGPLLVLICYLMGTFGVMAVVPASDASSNYSTLTAVAIVFGAPIAAVVGIIFIAFFLLVIIIYNIAFSRILFVSALDHRLPASLAKVNRNGVPSNVLTVQIAIAAVIAIFTYIIGPLLYLGQGMAFSEKVYDISQATITVIWCLSMVILFLDLPVLLWRFRGLLANRHEQLIAPPWFLYLCALIGGLASLLGIWTTLSSSWDNTLIPNDQWALLVGISAIVFLFVGLLGSAYPRLLSSLNEQTEAARENARLYSELQTAYQKLSELDGLKDAFLTTASHELRTPLTIVQGYLELLCEMDDEATPPALRRSFLNKARRACEELVLLQANIMDASRIEFDAATLQYTSIPLKDTCTAMLDLFEPLILQEQRQVELDIDEQITVWADETRLKQVLRNLIANALRYSPQRTPLRITASVDPLQEQVSISVIDRGHGVPPNKQEAIFERFVRLERDMQSTVRGSGLGLSITRQLIQAMGGTIHVESTGIPGKGSAFIFTLPTPTKAQTTPPPVEDIPDGEGIPGTA